MLSRTINRGTGTRRVRAGPPSSSAVSSRTAVLPNSTLSRDRADSHGSSIRHSAESSQDTTDRSAGTEKPSPPAAATPGALSGAAVTAAFGGDLRLGWSAAPGAVRHYELHRVLPDGTRRFLGGTCQLAWFAAGLQPEQGEQEARFELRAVGELYTSSDPVTVTHPW